MLQTMLVAALSVAAAGDSSFRPANVAFLMLEGVYNTELMAPFDVIQHVIHPVDAESLTPSGESPVAHRFRQ